MEHLLEAQTALARLPAILQYGLVTSFVLVALYGRYAVGPGLDAPRFIFLLPAVLLSVTLFSRAKWIYATLLSIAGMEFIFTEPALGFGFDTLAEVVALVSFVVICLLVSTLVESLKATASRLVVLNASLQKAVQDLARAEDQKSLLLYELNHRIKNDLGSIASTLNLQARSQTDHKVQDALLSASGRVNVLGRLYDRLHFRENGDAATLDSNQFIHQLCDDIRTALIGQRQISLEVGVESHELPMSQALPVGLITNELVTNALKYAFPAGRRGAIRVRFYRSGDNFLLQVSDDGVGVTSQTETGLGRRMIHALAQQIGGSLEVTGPPGLTSLVRFPAC